MQKPTMKKWLSGYREGVLSIRNITLLLLNAETVLCIILAKNWFILTIAINALPVWLSLRKEKYSKNTVDS